MTDASDVFNPKDFESIRLSIHFQNMTTRTEVKDTSKTALIEVGPKMLVLEVPTKSCNAKHNVMVKISKLVNAKDEKKKKTKKEVDLLSVTGKVLDIEETDDDVLRVTIECVQYDEKSWNELLGLYTRRQDEIEKFLAAAKGY